MTSEIQAAADFGVKYSRRIHSYGQEREDSEVETLDGGEQHPVVGLRQAEEQKKLPNVRRCFRAFKVNLRVLYLLILAGITTRYILVTLEKVQLQNINNNLRKDYSQLQTQLLVNMSYLQSIYGVLSKNHSQLQAKLLDMAANSSQLQISYDALSKKSIQLQEEVKELKNRIEGKRCPGQWARFGCSCYFKSTEKKTWDESRTDCKKRGADLVIINSEEEQKFVSDLTKRGESWMGLQAKYKATTRTHEWEWVDGSLLTKVFWAPGQPSPRYWYYAVCCDSNGKWTVSSSYEYYSGYSYKMWICEK